ncbi:unnamed protein product [Diamesa serratosioi]
MVLCQVLLRSSGKLIRQINPVKSQFTNSLRCFGVSLANNSERKYTNKHEWVMINGNIGTVGISNYAQEALGDVVYAQLPDVGTHFTQKDECGALESVKAASEIYSPVSGDVTEKNTLVEDTPGLVNTSCYDKGWLFKIKLTKPVEMEELLDENAYEEFLKTDAH